MNKVYIVFVETESGPDKINKIFKTHEAATNYVKSKCGLGGVHKVINQNMYIRLIIT